MATYTFAQLLSKLNTFLRDTADDTLTSAEKTEILTEIIENDPFCYKIARDTSLTTGTSTTSWTVPAGFEQIIDFGIDTDGNGITDYLDTSAWEQIDGTIYLNNSYYGLPANKTITLVGIKRLTTADDLPDYLVKYVLEVALAECFELLASVLGTRFLKNDITMAELRSTIANHQAKAERYRTGIASKRVTTW